LEKVHKNKKNRKLKIRGKIIFANLKNKKQLFKIGKVKKKSNEKNRPPLVDELMRRFLQQHGKDDAADEEGQADEAGGDEDRAPQILGFTFKFIF
jgi:hypothetical protein